MPQPEQESWKDSDGELFRLLVENATDYAIFLLDPKGHVGSWNPGAERIKGYRAEEVLGRHFSCFYPVEDVRAGKPEQGLRTAAAEGRFEDEAWRVRKDGSQFWASIVITALRDKAGTLKGFSKITRDLTERKRSEERFRLVVEAAPTGMLLIGRDGVICLANAKVAESFGYLSGELNGKAVEILVPDRFRERHVFERANFSAAPRPGRIGQGQEIFGRRKDGSEFPVEIGLQPLTIDEGTFVLASVIDITERVRVLAELSESEARFRQLADSIPQLVWMARPDGYIYWYNKRWYEYTGTTPAQMEGWGWQSVHDPAKLPTVLEGWRASISTGEPFDMVFPLRRADGQYGSFLTRMIPVRSSEGQILHWFGTNTDITERVKTEASLRRSREELEGQVKERKQAEAALRASERIYRAIGESINFGVWVCDPDGKNIYASPSFLRLVGLTQEQCAAFGWGDVLHPDDAERTIAAWKECVRVRGVWDIEHRFRGIDGKWHPVLARGVPVEDEAGKLLFWAGINLDISRLKTVEKALHQAHDELEQRVRERTVELTELNRRLSLEIEERRATEARLRDHAEEIETLMEVLPVPVWITHDQECRQMTGNRATYELTRLPKGANVSQSAPGNERPPFRAYHAGEEVAPQDLPMQQAAAAGTEVRNAELDLLFEDGSTRSIFGFAAPLFDRERRVRGCIGAFIDITERRRLEKRLRESEERYRAVVEDQTDVVSRFRADGTFLFANDVFCRTFGKSADEIIGQRWVPVAHPDDVPAIEAQLGKLSPDHPVVRVENRVFDAEGRVRWMEFVNRGFFGPDGALTEIQSVGRDVTERVQAEERLRIVEERMRLAMEAAQVSTWDWDIDRGEVVWSDNLESYLGMPPGTFGGTFDAFQSLIHPDDRQQIAGALDGAFRQRKPYQVEFRMIRPDGSVRWTATKGRAIYDPQGRPVRMLGVDVDVTERKQAENAIRAALVERETLLKEVHHRVKNNLQVISSLLHMQSLHTADKASAESFRESQHRVRSMALVHERLYRSPDLVRVDFSDYIEGLVSYLFRSYQANTDRIRLEVDVRGVRLPIDAAVPCGLLVNELVSNCLKHAFQGRQGEAIRIELVPATEAEALLCVSDNGVGLPPQANPETTETFGMQLIVALVDQLHGNLEVIRQDGTTVRVVFPLAK